MEADKSSQIQQRWESVYRERPLKELPWEEDRPSAELVALIESGFVEKGNALDICCGSANNAIYLAQKGFKSFAIDISPTAISYAREKASRGKVGCELATGNARQLPYHDESFTLIFDRGCFHSFAPRERKDFIKGVHRVLKPGGKYQLICWSLHGCRSAAGPPYAFSPQDIRRHFSSLFRIHSINEVTRDTGNNKRYLLSVLMEKPA